MKTLSVKSWLLIIATTLIVILSVICIHYKNKNYTVYVMNDSIEYYKNKLGEEYQSKTAYIMTAEDLKKQNTELYKEVKNLKDQLLVAVKTVTKTEIDSVKTELVSEDKIDSLYTFRWAADKLYSRNNGYKVHGTTYLRDDFSCFSTVLDKILIESSLTLNIAEKDEKYFQVLVRSDNPMVSFTDINGAIIDPDKSQVLKKYMKPKNFGLGIYAGYGIQGEMTQNRFSHGIQLGIGIMFSPNWLRF